ncbi:hypothetical protein ACHAW5_010687 [Stephanodiscus triporus]|uniref:Uncharacterized protein n=1 Tax=Stephanodiscus triporus TaxID=2934178 RepID=A0ABD3QUT9_9STRA
MSPDASLAAPPTHLYGTTLRTRSRRGERRRDGGGNGNAAAAEARGGGGRSSTDGVREETTAAAPTPRDEEDEEGQDKDNTTATTTTRGRRGGGGGPATTSATSHRPHLILARAILSRLVDGYYGDEDDDAKNDERRGGGGGGFERVALKSDSVVVDDDDVGRGGAEEARRQLPPPTTTTAADEGLRDELLLDLAGARPLGDLQRQENNVLSRAWTITTAPCALALRVLGRYDRKVADCHFDWLQAYAEAPNRLEEGDGRVESFVAGILGEGGGDEDEDDHRLGYWKWVVRWAPGAFSVTAGDSPEQLEEKCPSLLITSTSSGGAWLGLGRWQHKRGAVTPRAAMVHGTGGSITISST